MTRKFWFRTFRTLARRRSPYFAHLAFTHHCNLRCRFCHIREEQMTELDTEGMKRIIDRLDQLGVAVLSISGGGEPLLRRDFAELLNYASDKGLYTKLTSNGTMPQSKYRELLASKVSEIAISLDGVEGNDLPYSHCGPKNRETIKFLNDNLPAGMLLTLNITVSSANVGQVDEIVAYCTKEYPKARLWLNPVVVGEGKLRVQTEPKVNPGFFESVKSPTLLTPGFYRQACQDYYRAETYNWDCLAGEMFFDIKPNGDFWMCQDHAVTQPLNILDPDFEEKYREADFARRKSCGGCTYSCYYVTQKSFEPRYWPGLAEIWWKQNTRPDEPCRRTEREHGWVLGFGHFLASRMLAPARLAHTAMWVILLLALAAAANAQTASLLAPEEVIPRMEERNAQRQEALRSYLSERRYQAANPRLHRQGYAVVELQYRSPDTKTWRIVEKGGSGSIHSRVFEPLLKAEVENAGPAGRAATDLTRQNFTFKFVEFDEAARAYVFDAEPRTRNKYLFRGRLWINAEDFAVQRMEGEPAQRPSFWVKKTHFVREYAKFGDFWFPVRHRTQVDLRLLGSSTMDIDYLDYRCITGGSPDSAGTPAASPTLGLGPPPCESRDSKPPGDTKKTGG